MSVFVTTDETTTRTTGRVRRVLYPIGVAVAFGLGVYSLILASAKAGKIRPLVEEGLVRTATANDREKIALALGTIVEPELVYVVVEAPYGQPDPETAREALLATHSLADSGLVATVRHLEPIDPDYASIVEQNAIGRFPAVLVVKRNGGIVLVNVDPTFENLLYAYHTVWGKKSDCGASRDAVY